MSNSESNPHQLRAAYFAALQRDVMVYDALDDVLSQLALPSQGLRALCHDELSSDHQKHMLRVVTSLAAESGVLGFFEVLIANVALARRDWPLIAELGIYGISFDEWPSHLAPDGTAVNRLTQTGYFDDATWRFQNDVWIPRIYGEGRIEQVARHLIGSLIAIAALRHSERGAAQ